MKLYKICFDQDGTNHGTRVELAANVMSQIIFLSHWPLPLLLLAALCVLQVGVIDNKRLFVVQSRGELREGGDRQVFKEKYDNNYDYNIVRPLIMVPVWWWWFDDMNIQEPEITLYEGLQIMRRGRLVENLIDTDFFSPSSILPLFNSRFEDQRGTEICFEIPEFLRKPKEERDGQKSGENILK